MATAYTPEPSRPTTNPAFMDLRELVDLLGISLTVGYELARQDKLPIPTIRVGRQFRFSRAAYDALARAQHGPDRKTA